MGGADGPPRAESQPLTVARPVSGAPLGNGTTDNHGGVPSIGSSRSVEYMRVSN